MRLKQIGLNSYSSQTVTSFENSIILFITLVFSLKINCAVKIAQSKSVFKGPWYTSVSDILAETEY